MAMLLASAPRIFNVAVRRESIGLVAAAAVAISAFGLAGRHEARPTSPDKQDWVGHLPAVSTAGVAPIEPMSSSSLVIPKSALALPPSEPKPIVRARSSCDSADRLCVVRVAPGPAKRSGTVADSRDVVLPSAKIPLPSKTAGLAQTPASKGFSLNPLNHVPDMATVTKPFSAAAQAVGGWIKWL